MSDGQLLNTYTDNDMMMIKPSQAAIVFAIAYAVHLYLSFRAATHLTNKNTTVLLPTEPHPQLNYYLTGTNTNTPTADDNEEDHSDTAKTTTLVTIDNILPSQLLSAILSEIQSSIKTTTTENDNSQQRRHVVKTSCVLARDGGACGDERWIDFTLEDALRYDKHYDMQQHDNMQEAPMIEKDLFEQVILNIAKHDLIHVLPKFVSKHVKGVSWRILISTTGHNHQSCHYDSDEATDYAVKEVPFINPLLSTVTYLSDCGEPTIIFETSQLSNNGTIYHPTNAYISMPKMNKHLAFDSRLFHGSTGPLYVGKEGDLRIAIGTNFHTQRSLETIYSKRHRMMKQYVHRPLEVRYDKAAPPIVSDRRTTIQQQHQPIIKSWNVNYNMDFSDSSRTNWTSFYIKTNHQGRSYFASDKYKRSNITMRLPIDWIQSQEEKEPGFTVGFTLNRGDFNVSHDKDEVYRSKPKNRNLESKAVAREMLEKRCEIFSNDLLSMNPPLNTNFCSSLR
jgi:hypothetical protein